MFGVKACQSCNYKWIFGSYCPQCGGSRIGGDRVVKVSRGKVAEILMPLNCPVAKLRLCDRTYRLPSKEKVEYYLRSFEAREYAEERSDCDNRANLLLAHFSGLGYAFAWISIGPHDLGMFIDDNEKVWFIEPASKKIFEPSSDIAWLVMP